MTRHTNKDHLNCSNDELKKEFSIPRLGILKLNQNSEANIIRYLFGIFRMGNGRQHRTVAGQHSAQLQGQVCTMSVLSPHQHSSGSN